MMFSNFFVAVCVMKKVEKPPPLHTTTYYTVYIQYLGLKCNRSVVPFVHMLSVCRTAIVVFFQQCNVFCYILHLFQTNKWSKKI